MLYKEMIEATNSLIALYKIWSKENIDAFLTYYEGYYNTELFNYTYEKLPAMLIHFGTVNCLLCKTATKLSRRENLPACNCCLHAITAACMAHKTYKSIKIAKSSSQLAKAFSNRADYLEQLLKQRMEEQ